MIPNSALHFVTFVAIGVISKSHQYTVSARLIVICENFRIMRKMRKFLQITKYLLEIVKCENFRNLQKTYLKL